MFISVTVIADFSLTKLFPMNATGYATFIKRLLRNRRVIAEGKFLMGFAFLAVVITALLYDC